MDEFELFRAQAYSGGVLSSSPSSSSAVERSPQYLHENTSGSTSARRRRHSSAALGHRSPAGDRLGHQHPGSDTQGRWSPDSAALGRRSPRSDAQGYRPPGSDGPGNRFPGDTVGHRLPGSGALGHRTPGSAAVGHQHPGGDAQGHWNPASAALGQEVAAEGSGDSSHPQHHRKARDRRHRLVAGASAQHHQSLDQCGAYDARDAVVANVTVAVEPPSPTETRRQLNITPSPPSSTPSATSAATRADIEPRRADNEDDYDDASDVVGSNVKRRPPPQKSPLLRRVTSPEAVMRSSAPAEVTSEVGESIPQPVIEECSRSVAESQDYDIRSYLLPLPGTGSSPGQHVKRNSISNGNSLLPSSDSGTPRRNSCTGMVQSSSMLPLTPPRPTSRRNSAVTYLPDMPQGRTRSGLFNDLNI